MSVFQLNPEFSPQGDQAQAIAKLTKSLRAGNRHQTLLGVTGSGKTLAYGLPLLSSLLSISTAASCGSGVRA